MRTGLWSCWKARWCRSERLQELFEQPAHTFVGYFIGSPGMNVLPAVVDGRTARIGDSAITLGASYPKFAGEKKVEVGIRPEFLRIARGGQGLKVKVLRVEDAGSRRIVRAELGGVANSGNRGRGRSGACGLPLARARSRARHVYVDSKLLRA